MPVSASESRRLRDGAEKSLDRVVGRVVRSYLSDVKRVVLSAVRDGSVLTSSVAVPEPLPDGEIPSLGAQAGRWAAGVDAYVVAAIEEQFAKIYTGYAARGITMTSASESAMAAYVAKVRDRLVQGTYFGVTVYDQSFDAVRGALATGQTEGWSRPQLARRIAEELSWDTSSTYWDAQKSSYSSKIDAVLDSLGEPGTPAREYARLNDPQVNALRAQMNRATSHLDEAKSVWETRSSLIARTESTGVANFGAHQALTDEGLDYKQWIATGDDRTRPEHAAANGQIVKIDAEFMVGGFAMAHPGDPSAPADETANCRCTIIGSDTPE